MTFMQWFEQGCYIANVHLGMKLGAIELGRIWGNAGVSALKLNTKQV